MIQTIFVFIWIFVVAPYLIGILFCHWIKKEFANRTTFQYISGWILMFAIFQLICVPFDIKTGEFPPVVYSYTGTLLIGTLLGGLLLLYKVKNGYRLFSKKDWSNWYLIPIFFTILFLIFIIFYFPVDWKVADNRWYINISNTTYYTNTINQFHYWSGLPIEDRSEYLLEMKKFSLTSYNFWISWAAKIMNLPVLVVAHTVLYISFFVIYHIGFYVIGNILTNYNPKKNAIFLTILAIANAFFASSKFTLAFRLYVSVWWGKAVMAVLVIPFLFIVLYQILRERSHENIHILEWMLVAGILIAGISTSLMSIGLCSLMVVAVGMVDVFCHKKLKNGIPYIFCLIPQFYSFVLLYWPVVWEKIA